MSNFHKIESALKSYNHFASKSIAEDIFTKDEFMLTWTINEFCNFNCLYCGQYKTENPDTGKYPVEHIKNCFDKTGKKWHIIITGGEPFLYPDFVNLISALTENHYVSVNTNMSAANVPEFTEKINPERIIMINAGAHILEREKTPNGKEEYINRFLKLQEKGFHIVASYVAHPELLKRMVPDFEYLSQKGIKNVCAKTYSGNYNGKKYPDSYTDEENELIDKYSNGSIELPAYRKYTNFKNKYCLSGNRFYAMDAAGNITRCLSDNKNYGNLFKGSFSITDTEKKCISDQCICPYQGMLFSKKHEKKMPRLLKIFSK